ncbi:MAG TPA: signal peptidase II [Azospira sp.]|nr:signal peptidase II [Azospira sp.]
MPVPDRVSAVRWYVLAAVVIVLDQISKQVVLASIHYGETIYVAPFWNWVLTFNRGAAFSFLASEGGWQRWFFTVLALGVSGWIVFMLRSHAGQKLLSLALALIMGGALGNVIDRIRFGAVVDFVQWHVAGFYWPAFNIADSAITIGAVLMVWDQFFGAGARASGSDSR